MKSYKKIAAALTAMTLVLPNVGCGKNTSIGLTIDDYDVRAGIFIFYTINAYNDAINIIADAGTDTTNVDNIKTAHIDNITSTEWIQNKAVEYCSQFVAIEREFEKIGGALTADEITEVDDMLEYYTADSDFYEKNGIGDESLRDVMKIEYKRQAIFDYYYGFDSENGMSEDELKDYFNDTYARVEFITIDLKDAEGNMLKGDDKTELINLANEYADKVNECDSIDEKLFKMDDIALEYADFLALKEEEALIAAAEASGESYTTTTTTATTTASNETVTTTTTNQFANEQIVMKVTETTATDNEETPLDGEESIDILTTTEPVSYTPSKKSNEFIFNEAVIGEASVVEDTEAVYVILKADIYERMTDDDLWTETVIKNLQSQNYTEDFNNLLKELHTPFTVEKNDKSFKRYDPFKLKLN